jgi:lysophospholipase L1-like esterase
MSFLKKSGFDFRFMVMNNYEFSESLISVIAPFHEHMIKLEPGPSMSQFVNQLKLNLTDGFHPDVAGHTKIANYVLHHLSKGKQ